MDTPEPPTDPTTEGLPASRPLVVGVLSDTHGHLYPSVKRLLEGVDHVVHAGDVGSPQVLAALRALAPVTAVRGNCDLEAWANSLPARAEVELGGVSIVVSHIPSRPMGGTYRGAGAGGGTDAAAASAYTGDATPQRAPRVVVSGHTHRPATEERDGVLYLNPGSAGPERFGRPRTLVRLTITPASAATGGSSARPAHVAVELVVVPDS
jgi:hypothetical protein